MDEETLLRLTKELVGVADRAQRSVLVQITRRLTRGLTATDWQTRKLGELTRLRTSLTAALRRFEREGTRALTVALSDAFALGGAQATAQIGTGALPIPIAINRPALAAILTEAHTALSTARFQTLRAAEDIYRLAVIEHAPLIQTGALTRKQASASIAQHITKAGVSHFTDSAGRQWSLRAYTQMAARTATVRAATSGRLTRLGELGHDLVYVQDSPQECRLCRPWEGKVLSISGTHPEHPSVDDAEEAGLLHPNCRHTLTAYFPGRTRLPEKTRDPVGDAERQRTRYLERGTRRWREREAIHRAAGDKEGAAHARAKAREWSKRLTEHVEGSVSKQRRNV